MCRLAARLVAMIRIDAAWLATAPLDMRAGTDTALPIPTMPTCSPTSVPTG